MFAEKPISTNPMVCIQNGNRPAMATPLLEMKLQLQGAVTRTTRAPSLQGDDINVINGFSLKFALLYFALFLLCRKCNVPTQGVRTLQSRHSVDFVVFLRDTRTQVVKCISQALESDM